MVAKNQFLQITSFIKDCLRLLVVFDNVQGKYICFVSMK